MSEAEDQGNDTPEKDLGTPADWIPHRPPFLLLDNIVELTPERIVTTLTIDPDDPLWKNVYIGHYPGNPITPGVLLCEMVFQAGGVLMAQAHQFDLSKKSPVIARINDARFRRPVRPGETLTIEASFDEQKDNAFFMKGRITVDGAVALRVRFTAMLFDGAI